MSAYRDLVKKGDADHTQLTRLEFVLYVGGKANGGSSVLSEAARELAALTDLRDAIRETRHMGSFAIPAHVKAALELYEETMKG